MSEPTHAAVEAVWRIESARLVAGLARFVGDVGDAEELAQDALVAALQQWPVEGVPANPGGWLMSTAKHRAIDQHRRRQNYRRKLEEVGRMIDQAPAAEPDPIADDVLRLVFISCHPVLRTEGRVALTLRLLGGLSTAEIARALLVPEPTVGQRISRAKRALRGVPFELPAPAELPARLGSVLEVVYLVFNGGYAASAGADWTRPELCADALRLARLVAGLLPDQPEAHGLAALLELQASRLPARTGPDGEPVLLPDQDRRRWDRLLIRRGLAAGPGPGPRRRLRPVRAAGGDRGRARPRGHRGRDRLGPDRRALPGAGRGLPVPGGRAQPGRRGRHGRRPGGRAGRRRRPAGGEGAGPLRLPARRTG